MDAPLAIKCDIASPGYSALHVHRVLVSGGPTRGGGLAVVHKNTLAARIHPLSDNFKPTTFELQIVKMSSGSSNLAVWNIYRPPSGPIAVFLDELADIISTFLASCSDMVLLCDDLNCPGPDGTQVDDGLALLLSSLGLEQMIHMPTRGAALLDVLASDAPDIFTDVHVIDAGLLSDHRLLLVSCFIERRATRAAPTSYRYIKKINFQHFEAALHNSTIFSSPEATVDSFTGKIVVEITKALNEAAPLRTCNRRLPKTETK